MVFDCAKSLPDGAKKSLNQNGTEGLTLQKHDVQLSLLLPSVGYEKKLESSVQKDFHPLQERTVADIDWFSAQDNHLVSSDTEHI